MPQRGNGWAMPTARTRRWSRRRIEAVLGGAFAVLLVWAARVVDPSVPGRYPVCPFHALTGIACPGCGSLRAVGALSRGDLLSALDHNALLVGLLPVALVAWGWSLVGGAPRGTGRRMPAWSGFAVALVLVTWTVVRNIPAWPLTVLAP